MDWRVFRHFKIPGGKRGLLRRIWLGVGVAVVVALVVVPFGYAITGLHTDVLIGAGCGIAIGVGIGLRGGPQSGLGTGILVGSIVGIVAALIAGLVPGNPDGLLVPQVLALAVGLIVGVPRAIDYRVPRSKPGVVDRGCPARPGFAARLGRPRIASRRVS